MDKIFSMAIRVFMALSSVAYIPGTKNDEAQGMVFRVGVPVLFALSLYLKPVRFISNRWMNVLLFISVISVCAAKGMAQVVAIDPFINIFLGIALFYVMLTHAKEDDVIIGLLWAVSIHAILVLFQALGIDPILVKQGGVKTDMTGLFQYRYSLGVFMGTISAYLLWRRRFYWAILSGILTICSGSFAAIGIMIVSSVAVFWKYQMVKKVSIVIALYLLVFSIYRPDIVKREYDLKLKPRVTIFNTITPVILQKHFGYGMGSFKHIGPMIANSNNWTFGYFTDAWSDIIERSVEFGVGILVILSIICYDALRRGALMLVGIPLNMVFHSCLNHYSLSVLFIALFAIWEIRKYNEKTV